MGARPVAQARLPVLAVWSALVLLVVIGVVAAVGRGLHVADFAARVEPARTWLMEALHRADPFTSERATELVRVDGRFAAHRGLALLHVLPGGLFLLLAPLQFSSGIRTRHVGIHRWSGRILLLLGVTATVPAFYFGVLHPYAGRGEATAIAVFGALFLGAMARAFAAIRARDVAHHREWMIRAFATAIAISTVRLVALVADVALTPAGFDLPELFVLSLWTGWIVTVGAAEIWIRHTRPHATPLGTPHASRRSPDDTPYASRLS